VCQKLLTCKWDCGVSDAYCGALWYPQADTQDSKNKLEPLGAIISELAYTIENTKGDTKPREFKPYRRPAEMYGRADDIRKDT
jgi:hypothetical protein